MTATALPGLDPAADAARLDRNTAAGAALPDLDAMTATALRGEPITRAQALAVLRADDADTLAILAAAGRVRRHFFGTRVRLNYLINLKSGLCPEDCSYCSQALGAQAGILRYTWLSQEATVAAVDAGVRGGAKRICLVASGRGPSDREVGQVAGIISSIKEHHPDVEVCACLGMLDADKARRLHEAGADAYNHNLNTAASNYAEVCSTHSYSDRQATIAAARSGGLSSCSGLIAGIGETDEELVDVVFALRDIGADSIPVNFLMPFEGTPMAERSELTPQRCLRILALTRFVHPDREVRAAGGREYHLRTLQPLALEVCSSIFLGDYLTSEGQAGAADLQMIKDCGFTIEGGGPSASAEEGTDAFGIASEGSPADVPIRRRGVGTAAAPNA